MTKDEIDDLMRDNGIVVVGEAVYALCQLVAEHEREACAKVFENTLPLVDFVKNDMGGCMICGFTPALAAKAIRARGQA